MTRRREQTGLQTLEFVGLPGAGKSTLSERVRRLIAATGGTSWDGNGWRLQWIHQDRSTALRRLRHIALKIKTAITECRLLGFVLAALSRTPNSWRLRLLTFRLVLFNLEAHHVKAPRPAATSQFLVIDEGLLQLALRLFLYEDGRFGDPTLYARTIPAPDLIVQVRASPQVALERARSRRRGLPSRFRTLSNTDLEAVMTGATELIDHLVREVVRTNPACRLMVLEVDDGDAAHREIERLVEQMTGGAKKRGQDGAARGGGAYD
jgi:thymidylate kinase